MPFIPSRQEESTVPGALDTALDVVAQPKVVLIVLNAEVLATAAAAVGLALNAVGGSSPAGGFRAPAVNAASGALVVPDEA